MQTPPLRIGFVGTGTMGQCAHLRNYACLETCRVVALAEMREDLAAKVATRYGVSHVYTSPEDMLANETLDGIVASQPFTRHGVLLPGLLEAGVPVFIEKPLASTVAVGEALVAAAAASPAFVMVGYHKRSDPATMLAKKEITRLQQTGELGSLRYVRILMPAGDWIAGGFNELLRGEAFDGQLKTDPPAADMDKETFGRYTAFVNYYIHQVNLMRHLLGESYAVRYADPSGVLLAGESASGVACAIEMSPYHTSIDWQESALVCFEKGYVRLSLPAPLATNRPGAVEILRDPGSRATPVTERPQLPWVHAMRQQAVNFLAAIRGEMLPMCDAAEALEDLRVAREYVRFFE